MAVSANAIERDEISLRKFQGPEALEEPYCSPSVLRKFQSAMDTRGTHTSVGGYPDGTQIPYGPSGSLNACNWTPIGANLEAVDTYP
jgi:hypothetical protein